MGNEKFLKLFKFGFGYCKGNERLEFSDLSWFDKKLTKKNIVINLEKFFLKEDNKYLRDLYPASIYFFWKKLIWPKNYYGNILKKYSIQDFDFNQKGNDRFLEIYGRKNNLFIRAKNCLVIIINFITLLIHEEITLIYLISSKPSKLISSYLDSNSKVKNSNILFIKKLNMQTLIEWILRRNSIFMLNQINLQFEAGQEFKFLRNYLDFLYKECNYFENLLSSKKLKFIGEDDPSRIYGILLAMKKLSIETTGFQHGLYSELELGYNVALNSNFLDKLYWWFDKIYVVNNTWLEIIQKLQSNNKSTKFFSKSDKKIHLINKIDFHKISIKSQKIIIVLDCYSDIKAYKDLYNFLKEKKLLFKSYFRPHPSMNKEEINLIQKKVLILKNTNYEISKKNLYICFKSTFAIELIDKEMNVFFYRSNLNFLETFLDKINDNELYYLN